MTPEVAATPPFCVADSLSHCNGSMCKDISVRYECLPCQVPFRKFLTLSSGKHFYKVVYRGEILLSPMISYCSLLFIATAMNDELTTLHACKKYSMSMYIQK